MVLVTEIIRVKYDKLYMSYIFQLYIYIVSEFMDIYVYL